MGIAQSEIEERIKYQNERERRLDRQIAKFWRNEARQTQEIVERIQKHLEGGAQ
jgi:GAF domain-containing protein